MYEWDYFHPFGSRLVSDWCRGQRPEHSCVLHTLMYLNWYRHSIILPCPAGRTTQQIIPKSPLNSSQMCHSKLNKHFVSNCLWKHKIFCVQLFKWLHLFKYVLKLLFLFYVYSFWQAEENTYHRAPFCRMVSTVSHISLGFPNPKRIIWFSFTLYKNSVLLNNLPQYSQKKKKYIFFKWCLSPEHIL